MPMCESCGEREAERFYRSDAWLDPWLLCQPCVGATRGAGEELTECPPSPEQYRRWVADGGPALVQAELAIAVEPLRTIVERADRGLLTATDVYAQVEHHLRLMKGTDE